MYPFATIDYAELLLYRTTTIDYRKVLFGSRIILTFLIASAQKNRCIIIDESVKGAVGAEAVGRASRDAPTPTARTSRLLHFYILKHHRNGYLRLKATFHSCL